MPDTNQPRTLFRSGKYLDSKLTERAIQGSEDPEREDTSKDATAKRDLTRWYDSLEANVQTFTMDEALLLCHCLNGVKCSPDTLYANIATADEFSSEQFEVDKPALLKRLHDLEYMQAWFVIDAIERAWNAPEYRVDLKKRVLLVGLVK
mgnify:CR=1 FL=1